MTCSLCGATGARLYPGGRRCDTHAPWAGRPTPGATAYGEQHRAAVLEQRRAEAEAALAAVRPRRRRAPVEDAPW